MKKIIQANINHFKQLLETTTDQTKRTTLLRLLSEEEAKMEGLEAPPATNRKTP